MDGADAAVVVSDMAQGLDVALLAVEGDPPWGAELPGGSVAFGRVDREHTGELEGCEAVGFPRWQAGETGNRDVGEVHGVIRVLEGMERQRLVLRDPVLGGVTAADGGPAWAGFSGAAVFHDGLLIGVIIEHHPRQGDTALELRPIEAVAKAGDDDDAARRLKAALGIGGADALPLVAVGPGRWRVEEAGEEALARWGWSLAGDEEGVRHWRPRARGVSNEAQNGWRFRGRTSALERIVAWLDRPQPDRQVLVVTGSPGAGKSAVLGRVVTTADSGVRAALPADDIGVRASPGSVSCAVHAKGKTALDVAKEIARAARAAPPGEPAGLVTKVQDALRERGTRFNVIIDALDESAGPEEARDVIDHVVLPLSQDCASIGVQVAVGTRRRDDRGDLLDWFGPATDLIDLDDPGYFEPDDLAAYAQIYLQLEGGDGNPYADAAVARPLAGRIAQVSGKNFLIAGLIARSYGLRPEAADPGQFAVPQTVRSALDGYLRRLASVTGVSARNQMTPAEVSARDLLTALAFAESPGLPAGLWQLAVKTLYRVDVAVEDLAEFARSAAANFLVETAGNASNDTADPAVTPAYRLFHQALNDTLLHTRADVIPRIADEQLLTRTFTARGRDEDWDGQARYLLRSLPGHAARAGLIDDLLTDDAYPLHADLGRLIPAADDASSTAARGRARLLRLTPQAIIADAPAERAALFSVTEALDNLGCAYRDSRWQAPYRARWAVTRPRTEHVSLEGHHGAAYSVCAVTVDGQELLASGSDDGTVRLWNPCTGEELAVFEGHCSRVNTVCTVTLDDQNLLASGSRDRTVRLWNPRNGEQRTIEDHGWFNAVCVVTVDGQTLLASGSSDGTVRLWNPRTGEQFAVFDNPGGRVYSVCVVRVDGRDLLGIGDDHAVRLWNPQNSEHHALKGHHNQVSAVCAVSVDGQELLASGSDDGTVRLWDPHTHKQRAVFEGHGGAVKAVCAVTVRGQNLLAIGSVDRAVRLWDPRNSQQRTLDGHYGRVSAVCAVTVDGQEQLASGSNDGTVQLWDPRTGKQRTLEGHHNRVSAMCPVMVDGQEMLATAPDHDQAYKNFLRVASKNHPRISSDWQVTLWDPRTGNRLRTFDTVSGAVCAVTVDGQEQLAIAPTGDWELQLWDPRTGKRLRRLGKRLGHHAICVVTVNGRDLLVTRSNWGGDSQGDIELRDPRTGEQFTVLKGHKGCVGAVCVVTVNGRELLASGGNDGTVRLWAPPYRTQLRVLTGHTGKVNAVCTIQARDRTLLVTASNDKTVRLWNPADGTCALTVPVHHPALAVTPVADSLAVGLAEGMLVLTFETGTLLAATGSRESPSLQLGQVGAS
ncbi:MAG TPA: WD40 repeat domain-containing protein [Streptosporangiaceae bacterium]|nr:WD40 repeat domain-containing protein [Streptosporangiaceae bacterium]